MILFKKYTFPIKCSSSPRYTYFIDLLREPSSFAAHDNVAVIWILRDMFDMQTIFYLIIGAAAGGFINGLSGTGTALFALGFYLAVLDPTTSVLMVALLAILVGVQGLFVVRHNIFANPVRLLRFTVSGLVGVPIGTVLLNTIDVNNLKVIVAAFLILYGVYFGFRSSLPTIEKKTPIIDTAIAFIGGTLGGAAALSGAVPQIWLSLRPWPKSEVRAMLQPFNFAVLGTTSLILLLAGNYDKKLLLGLMITLPVGYVSAQLGLYIFKLIDDTLYRRTLVILTLCMGIATLASTSF